MKWNSVLKTKYKFHSTPQVIQFRFVFNYQRKFQKSKPIKVEKRRYFSKTQKQLYMWGYTVGSGLCKQKEKFGTWARDGSCHKVLMNSGRIMNPPLGSRFIRWMRGPTFYRSNNIIWNWDTSRLKDLLSRGLLVPLYFNFS